MELLPHLSIDIKYETLKCAKRVQFHEKCLDIMKNSHMAIMEAILQEYMK